MSHTIEVPINYQKNYTIHIGNDIWDHIIEFSSDSYAQRLAFVVIDEQVHRLHFDKISRELGSYFDRVETYVVPEGEQSKNSRQWQRIVDFILKNGAERGTPLFAIGGGVTGDLAGFAASSALRGIPLIHLPTTLLAMVDSSIGGKTGINHDVGKNLIGAFYQPDAVFADTQFLGTLDRGEWINGLSEVLKYGAIRAPEIFDTAASLIEDPGFKPTEAWAELIAQSAEIKVRVVEKDTLEAGTRAFLNYGHTFGHALEKRSGYGNISHGQAVFIGMIAATYASVKLGADIESARFEPFKSLYPIQLQELVPERSALITAMKTDKKVQDGQIRLILLDDWGSPYIYPCEGTQLIEDAWSHAYEKFS
ncbi:3-dehydroquinate synthase [Aliifodinibius sp. S!AR15-10]|uniref:3-dehydroquinate synthase n=1 Tax=Aliifodinibius sp. S!AR15-10 TaxID=2950437 RepID=UPI0028643F7B|nr:3-dehydroquinate synthase [Aliifodinibius sp. S!AR15-10]MDR8390402.1 3-dehydroquinate synthase [Aliifodinibius sp. S!AR15-10]